MNGPGMASWGSEWFGCGFLGIGMIRLWLLGDWDDSVVASWGLEWFDLGFFGIGMVRLWLLGDWNGSGVASWPRGPMGPMETLWSLRGPIVLLHCGEHLRCNLHWLR